ncbi:hypothetical protein PspS35_17460 [Pseudomonas sp. S35]|uniref:hypothetical protein n=1 Tax=Pseudomonas sp. S35 TaxID=1573719 RepID=UPI00132EEE3F|nr:hypothetical protein [Pseudomonas sp. S35]QHF45490.1 hypothetical protein PspS35_17460 [Pseudomonas sp. S35]
MYAGLLIAGLMAFPTCAFAELNIVPLSNSDKAKRLEQLNSTAPKASSAKKETAFPTLAQFERYVSVAKQNDVRLRDRVLLASYSRARITGSGCTLRMDAPSGVEDKNGDFNGVMSVYLCADAYVVTYEADYTRALKQSVTVYDDEYSRTGTPGMPLIKENTKVVGGVKRTIYRWLNPVTEIRYEIFTSQVRSEDEVLLVKLKAALRETLLEVEKRP